MLMPEHSPRPNHPQGQIPAPLIASEKKAETVSWSSFDPDMRCFRTVLRFRPVLRATALIDRPCLFRSCDKTTILCSITCSLFSSKWKTGDPIAVSQLGTFTSALLSSIHPALTTFRLSHPQEHTRLGDGTVISASIGASLWTGTIRLAQANHARHAQMEALIGIMDQPGATFLCHDPRNLGPASDPSGVILGSWTATIHSVAGNMRALRLTGLPSGYDLSAGDMLGFQYGANPVRYTLHRIGVGGTASSGGLTPLLELVPNLRPGAAPGITVSLVRPACKARLRPEPSFGSRRQAISRGASFEFIQTLR